MAKAYDRVAAFFDPDKFSAAVDHEKRKILGPYIQKLFNLLDVNTDEQNKVLDYGCGPFLIGNYLHENGFFVDGYDIDPNMIAEAGKTFPLRGDQLMVSELEKLGSASYSIVLMSFVHQIAPTRERLRQDFLVPAANLVTVGGRLIIIGANPETMGIEFSAMLCTVENRADGSRVTGRLFSDKTDAVYEPTSDHYWATDTVKTAVAEIGFSLEKFDLISDVPSAKRPAGPPGREPYYVLVMRRTGP